jgi:PAS domain S-box-containing protein
MSDDHQDRPVFPESSEELYRTLVEQVPAVVYVVAPDDDRRTLYASSQVERALGYSREEWLEQPDIWMELLHPDDRERTLAAHDEHNLTGEPWSREYRLIASDGRAVWFRDVATLVRDTEGRPLYWQGVQLDITELKGVEEELRSSKEQLEIRVAERTAELEEANALMSLEIGERRRAEEELRKSVLRSRVLAEQIPAVAYVWSVDPRDDPAFYTSPRIEQLLGYTVEEWEADPDFWISRLHPDDRQQVLAASMRSETTGEPFSIEYRYLHKDGHIVWVLDEAMLLERDEAGKPKTLQGITLDITARKTAEARATEADERYRTLVEQIPAITYIEIPSPAADESRLLYLSPQTREIVGYTPEELIADPSHFRRMLHPDDRERVIALNARCERAGEPFDAEYRVIAKDGTVVWLHSKATLVRDSAGIPRFWHGVSMDITALYRAEEHARELETRYEQLANRVTGSERSGG